MVEDMSNVQSFVQVAFKAFGYTWEHPRVADWLKIAESRGSKCNGWNIRWVRKSGVSIARCIPPEFYRMLAICMIREMYHGEEQIQDLISYVMAVQETRSNPSAASKEPALMRSLANSAEIENRALFKQLGLNLIGPGTKPWRAA